jgi:uncharacterized protein YicC (UPF0701 family)
MLSPLEAEIKKGSGAVLRGRVEATVRLENDGGGGGLQPFRLNVPRLQNYYALLGQIKEA